MRKVFFFPFFLMLIFRSEITFSQYLPDLPLYENKNSSNALILMNLKGKVKSIQQNSFKALEKDGTVQKGEKGNSTTGISVDSDFNILFDDKGRAKQETFSTHSSEITPWNKTGEPIGQTSRTTHEFNDQAKTETVELYEGTSGKMNFRYIYKYNIQGKLTEYVGTQFFNNNTSEDYKVIFRYEELGNISEKDIFNYNGTVSKIVYTYDNKGNLISEGRKKDSILLYMATYKTDDKGNIIEHNFYNADGKNIDHTFILKYDSHTNIIQKKYCQLAGKLFKTYSYTYEYDKNNNWIKRIDREDGKATYIMERQLDYYD